MIQSTHFPHARGMLLLVFALLAWLPLGAADERPNVAIFIADDVSWDDLGCYGNEFVDTPNIDRLAAGGIRFDNAYLTTSSCSPTRNSIMTGRYPHNTGAAELHTQPPEDMLSFPEILKQNGYYSGHSGKFHMGTYADRGFDVIYRSREDIGNGGEKSWLKMVEERPTDQPFFMWFAALDAHRAWGPNPFSGTHDPDRIKPPFYLADDERTRQDLAQYYDEIKRFDHHIGLVLDELERQGALDNTLVIIMADNGRPFPHSKTRVNDRGVKTPFVLSWPKRIREPAVSDSLISVIDIAPTLFHLADVETPAQFQGHSFHQLIDQPDQPFRNYLFAEHNWHDYEAHERMVRSRDFLYIENARPEKPQLGPADAIGSPSHEALVALRAKGRLDAAQADVFVTPRPREELYDCRSDPQQLLNLAAVPEYRAQLESMRKVLQQWREETGDTTPANLTRDYFLPVPGYIRTAYYQTRGEMPGAKQDATQINRKGPF